MLASALNPVNSSMLATGLADIAREFDVTPGAAAGLVSVLYLCSAIAQPAVGKLGVVFGPRRVFLSGILLVMLGGVIGLLAGSFVWLLVSRALIGIGTAAAFPTSMALVRARADQTGSGAPTRSIGLLSIAAQASLVVGLPLGGLLTSLFGWRSLFAVNIPLALITLVAVLMWVERDSGIARRTARELLTALDVVGIVLFTAVTAGLLIFLSDLERPLWWLLAVIITALVLLIVWERRASAPLLDVRLLVTEPALARTYLRQFLSGLAVFTALYGLSQWMRDAAGFEASAIGVILLPLSAVSILLARIVSVRGWVRGSLIWGALAVVAAGAMLLVVRSDTPGIVPLLIGVAIVYGAAHGLTGVATQTALYLQAPADQIGTAAGLLRSFGHIGAIFSASVISVTFGAQPTDAGLHLQGWVIAGLGALLFVLALDRSVPRHAGPR